MDVAARQDVGLRSGVNASGFGCLVLELANHYPLSWKGNGVGAVAPDRAVGTMPTETWARCPGGALRFASAGRSERFRLRLFGLGVGEPLSPFLERKRGGCGSTGPGGRHDADRNVGTMPRGGVALRVSGAEPARQKRRCS